MSVSSEKSPSIIGVYFYASLMALLGGLLGFVYLTTFPAQSFATEKEYQTALADSEEEGPVLPHPGNAYFIEGPVVRSRGWETKRQQFSASGPQTIRLSAGELNGWMDAKFRPGAAPAGDDSGVLIVPGVPNIAFAEDGTVFLNIPTSVSGYGASNDYTVFARCQINTGGLNFDSVSVSSALVPMPSLLGKKVLEVLAKGYQSTEEYEIVSEAFARAESISVDQGELVFKLR